jgi:hypothetical protein
MIIDSGHTIQRMGRYVPLSTLLTASIYAAQTYVMLKFVRIFITRDINWWMLELDKSLLISLHTLVLFYKQHMIKKTSWMFLDFIKLLLIFVA